jgi:hypothetical protein
MNVDEMLERMNKEVWDDVSKGYDQLCEKIRLVNVAILSMNVEVQHVARQVYAKGVAVKDVVGIDGRRISSKKVYQLLHAAEKTMMDMIVFHRQLIDSGENG